MSAPTRKLGPVATLDAHRVASPVALTRATVRYALTDTLAQGATDAGALLGLAVAHCEAPGTFSDVSEADIDAMLATLGE